MPDSTNADKIKHRLPTVKDVLAFRKMAAQRCYDEGVKEARAAKSRDEKEIATAHDLIVAALAGFEYVANESFYSEFGREYIVEVANDEVVIELELAAKSNERGTSKPQRNRARLQLHYTDEEGYRRTQFVDDITKFSTAFVDFLIEAGLIDDPANDISREE